MKAMVRIPHLTKLPQPPIAWRKAECAMRQVNVVDTCDDRVSENIFDVEDERAAVEFIVRWMDQGVN